MEEKIEKFLRNYLFVLISLFSLFFEISIVNIEVKYFIYFIIFIFSLLKNIRYKIRFLEFILLIFLILIYSLIVQQLNSQNFFISLRITRSLFSAFALYYLVENSDLDTVKNLELVEMIVFLHSLVIIFGILFPSLKSVFEFISHYNKEFMQFRSTGLLSGYDDAGFIVLVALCINVAISILKDRREIINLRFLVFSISIFFTSRINMLLYLIFVLLISIVFRNNVKKSKYYNFINGISLLVMSLFFILTTGLSLNLKTAIFLNIPFIEGIYQKLLNSYTDYGYYSYIIVEHLTINSMNLRNILFGGLPFLTYSDVGYIKSISSLGLVGSVLIYASCIYPISFVLSHKIDSELKVLLKMSLIIMLLTLLMELKTSIVYSSTSFELLMYVYILLLLRKNKETYSIFLMNNEK